MKNLLLIALLALSPAVMAQTDAEVLTRMVEANNALDVAVNDLATLTAGNQNKPSDTFVEDAGKLSEKVTALDTASKAAITLAVQRGVSLPISDERQGPSFTYTINPNVPASSNGRYRVKGAGDSTFRDSTWAEEVDIAITELGCPKDAVALMFGSGSYSGSKLWKKCQTDSPAFAALGKQRKRNALWEMWKNTAHYYPYGVHGSIYGFYHFSDGSSGSYFITY